jgi:amidase
VVKDLGCPMAGEPHYMGTRALQRVDYRAPVDAALYRRFRAAGLVAIGRTNTPELGSTITTEPVSFGPARNPWNTAHSTGGSSGGSAAAVAAGIVAVGHATDGGGSIRVPASECGLVGLKPTRGRISQAPIVGEGWAGYTADGVVTRSVRDTAALLDLMSGYEPGDPYSAVPFARPLVEELTADPQGLRMGLLDRSPHVPSHPECEAAVAAAGELLQSLGHHVEAAAPAAMFDEGMVERFLTVICANTAYDVRFIAAQIGHDPGPDDLEGDNLFYDQLGRATTAADYIAAVDGNHRWSRAMLSWWHPAGGERGFDVLVTPVIATPPPPIGYLAGTEGAQRVREVLQFTAQFNVTGQPAISLPLHMTADGLPVGVQFVAAHGREDLLIALAAQIERAAPWHGRRPV